MGIFGYFFTHPFLTDWAASFSFVYHPLLTGATKISVFDALLSQKF